jgi:hypothetical protein
MEHTYTRPDVVINPAPQAIDGGMRPPRNYADPEKTVFLAAGILTFGIEYRHLQGDQGICIHVFGEVNGQEEEVLRFDCFERAPHYHYAWSTNDQYMPLDTTAAGDPLQWVLERLRTRLPAMLLRSGAPDLARALDQREIDAAIPKITGWAEMLQTQDRLQRNCA